MKADFGIEDVHRIHQEIVIGDERVDVGITISPFGKGQADVSFESIPWGTVFDMVAWVKKHSYPYSSDGYVVPTVCGWTWYRLHWYRSNPT